MLNKLKVVGNFPFIYTPWAPSSKKFLKKFPIYMWFMFTHVRPYAPMCELWLNLNLTKVNWEIIKNELKIN
jgi:hypothetical protein